MVASRMSEQIGRVLSGRYRLVAPIGSGASALVFLADDTRLRRRVAVKLLHHGLADDEAFLRRFRSEAQSAAALNHPHILAVYDWGEDDAEPYLVTEYLAGGSLRSILDKGLRLTPSQALMIGLEATRALDHAHTRGFVHRDIKPANLLFGEEGRLRIGDFGLARALAEAAWTEPAGVMVGTARYASPEQARGEPVDGKGDVYSLVLVLIEAVTGSVPFAADTTIATLMARVAHPIEVPEALGPLRNVLARAGQADPGDRPDAAELAIGLLAAAEDLSRPERLPLGGPGPPSVQQPDAGRDPTLMPLGAGSDLARADTVRVDAAAAAAPMEVGRRRHRRVPIPAGNRGGRRRWGLVAGLAVLVVALVAVAVLVVPPLLVPSHPVPALVRLTEQQARLQIDANNWAIRKVEARRDGTLPGEIIDQDPPPASELKENETVTITVSLGNELRQVPLDLSGQTTEAAAATLAAAGLTLGTTTEEFDESVPQGSVIKRAPDTPSEVPRDGPVNLIVSRGPTPRVVPAIPAGSTSDQAVALLSAVQLKAARKEVFSETVPTGQIMGTEPAAGAEAARDSTVQVLFSKGPQPVPVPDVRGANVIDATNALQASGLRVTGVRGNPFARVRSTDPATGTPVPRGAGVVLVTG
ncbi:MAG: protein kinase domain-containing protein [Acidimicrobiia bacterium]